MRTRATTRAGTWRYRMPLSVSSATSAGRTSVEKSITNESCVRHTEAKLACAPTSWSGGTVISTRCSCGCSVTPTFLPADSGHRTYGLQETRIIDAVTGAFGGDGRQPPVGQLVVGGARAHRGAQVGLLTREQAVADLPVGGQPYAVAGAAEGPGHRGDDADRRRAAVDQEPLGGRAAPRVPVVGGQLERLGQAREDLVGGDHALARPAVLGIERHLLDEAQLVPLVQAEPQQGHGLVVVHAAHEDGVDLDRAQAGALGGGQPREDVGEPVAVG